jgi:hypothetical protein
MKAVADSILVLDLIITYSGMLKCPDDVTCGSRLREMRMRLLCLLANHNFTFSNADFNKMQPSKLTGSVLTESGVSASNRN